MSEVVDGDYKGFFDGMSGKGGRLVRAVKEEDLLTGDVTGMSISIRRRAGWRMLRRLQKRQVVVQ